MRVIVLFNLKPGVSRDDYERWAQETDLPTVNGLKSIDGFNVLRATGLLGGGAAPYDYIEVLDIGDMDVFRAEVADETMQRVASQFREFADNPQFIATETVG